MANVPRSAQFTAKGTMFFALTVALAFISAFVVGGLLFGQVIVPMVAQAQSLPTTGVVITEEDRLNLRAEPSTDGEIIGKIEPQTTVTVLDESDDAAWYQVEVAGIGTGWVSSAWVSLGDGAGSGATNSATSEIILIPTPTPNPTTSNQAGSNQAASNQSGNGESSGAPRLGVAALISVPANSAAADNEPTPTIAKTTVTTATSGATASATTVAPTATSEATISATATVTADVTSTATAAATATAEATVQATATSAATPTPTPTPTPTVPTAIIQPDRMNVRAGPGTNFAIVTGVDQGTALEITGASPLSDWYRVNLAAPEGEGWVFASLVQVIGPADAILTLSEEELPAAPTPDPVAASQSVPAAPPIVGAPPPSGAGFYGYGVQAHMLGGGISESMNAVSDLGFGWIKQQVNWSVFGNGYGEIGAIVNEAGARGINVLLSVVDAPEWAREPGFDGSVGGPPADPGSYAAYVGGMAGQFCGTALKAIEVWNEQNLHYEWGNKPLDPAEYMRLLKAAYASIKAACPSMLVISGALTPAGSNPPFAMDDFAYLEAMYQNGLADYSDGIGAHPSGYNVPASVRFEQACATIQQTGNTFNGACDTPHHSWSFRSTMEGYRNIMNVYGDSNKRIWPTEFGWAAGGAFDPRYAYANDNSFDEQAQWTVEAYTMMRDWGWVGPAFLWNLNFRVVADGTEKAQWGIVGNDWSPLPVYSSLKSMAK